MNEERFYDNCFTEVENGVNAEFNKVTTKCFDSVNNAFSMDCDGNLVVNSIITRQGNLQGLSFNDIYPVGSIYMSVNSTSPATLFGGTWEQIKGKFLLGCGNDGTNNYAANSTGGEKTHKLTEAEMPSHTHSFQATTTTNGQHTHKLRRDLVGNELGIYGGTLSGNSLSGTWSQTTIYENSIGAAQAGNHNHTISGNTGSKGSSNAHNNMPPYLAVYIWKRIS